MIDGFFDETKSLTEYEEQTLLPVMVKCLQRHIGIDTAISNRAMCEALDKKGYSINEKRIRKVINYIRVNGLVDCLVACSKGYYVASTRSEVQCHISSLQGREEAIRAVRNALERQMEGMGE